MTAPDLAARAKQMERDFRYDADHGNSPRPKALIDAADLIRDLRAEIERLKKSEAEVIDETARFNRGWDRRAEPYRLLEDEFEQMGWAWAHVDEMAALRARHEELRRDFEHFAPYVESGVRALCPDPTSERKRLDAARAKWKD